MSAVSNTVLVMSETSSTLSKENDLKKKFDTHWYLINPRSTLDRHLISIIFSSQSVKSQLTLDWCMWLSWHSAHFRLTLDQESTEYQLGCRLSVNQEFDWVSITGRLRVLIDTRPHMHLVNMIYFLSIYSVNRLWTGPKTNLNCY